MHHGLHWVDAVILAIYSLGMIGLGWYFNRGQRTATEYFTGNRAMSPTLIGISLFATLLSTITYLSSPGELIKHGPVILTGSASIVISYFIVAYWLIPAFMRQRLTSAYELLEQRLGPSVRVTGALMFILLRLMWMATLLNFAAHAMLVMLDIDGRWLPVLTTAIGTVAVLYSSLGGLRAVVITDFIQFILLLGGAVMVIVTVSVRMKGFGWWPSGWHENWDSQPFFTLDPHVRLSVVGVIVMQTLWTVCTAGGDQTAVQRFMATRDADAARRAYLVNSIAAVVVVLVLALVGLSLLGYFHAFPQRLPGNGMTVADVADDLFPRYISHELPIGLSGLVISGMFAAAMSSVDSGVNSISAVVTTDFLARFRREPLSEAAQLRAAKWSALMIGVTVIAGSTLIDDVPGNFLEVSKRVGGLLVTPLFTLFFMALFVPFATAAGANIGALCGFLTAVLIAYWSPLVASTPISITWINPCALAVSVSAGCIVSLFERRIRRS